MSQHDDWFPKVQPISEKSSAEGWAVFIFGLILTVIVLNA